MKEITAVQCICCEKLIPKDHEFAVVNTMAIFQRYKNGAEKIKCNVQDEVFCNAECIMEYIQQRMQDF